MVDDALLAAFGFDDATQAPPTIASNGHAYHLVCFGCGREYGTNRRELPDRHNWCPDCRKAGKPNAQRARDFRAARSKIAEVTSNGA